MSSGPASGRLLRVFLILLTFASGRLPSADDSDPVGTVRKDHQQQPILIRMPNHDRTILARRLRWIGEHLGQWIAEHRRGLVKRNAVLLDVGTRLGLVP